MSKMKIFEIQIRSLDWLEYERGGIYKFEAEGTNFEDSVRGHVVYKFTTKTILWCQTGYTECII